VENHQENPAPTVENLELQDKFTKIRENRAESEIETCGGDNLSVSEKSSGTLHIILHIY
jgi:hypothetical protein